MKAILIIRISHVLVGFFCKYSYIASEISCERNPHQSYPSNTVSDNFPSTYLGDIRHHTDKPYSQYPPEKPPQYTYSNNSSVGSHSNDLYSRQHDYMLIFHFFLPVYIYFVDICNVPQNYPYEPSKHVYHRPYSRDDHYSSISYSPDYPSSIAQPMLSQHDQSSFGYGSNQHVSPDLSSAPFSNPISQPPSSGIPYQWHGEDFNYDEDVGIPMQQSHISPQLSFPNQIPRNDPRSHQLPFREFNSPPSCTSRDFHNDFQFSRNHQQFIPSSPFTETDILDCTHSSVYSSFNQPPSTFGISSQDDGDFPMYSNPPSSGYPRPSRNPIDPSPPFLENSDSIRMNSFGQVNEFSGVSTLYSRGNANCNECIDLCNRDNNEYDYEYEYEYDEEYDNENYNDDNHNVCGDDDHSMYSHSTYCTNQSGNDEGGSDRSSTRENYTPRNGNTNSYPSFSSSPHHHHQQQQVSLQQVHRKQRITPSTTIIRTPTSISSITKSVQTQSITASNSKNRLVGNQVFHQSDKANSKAHASRNGKNRTSFPQTNHSSVSPLSPTTSAVTRTGEHTKRIQLLPIQKVDTSSLSLSTFSIPPSVSFAQPIVQGQSLFRTVKKQLNNAIRIYSPFTSPSSSPSSLTVFLSRLQTITESYPTCFLPWVEWMNAYYKSGDLEMAVRVLTTATAYLPNIEIFLEKRIRLASEIRRCDLIALSSVHLLRIKTPRGIQSGVDGLLLLASLGMEQFALRIYGECIEQLGFKLNICSPITKEVKEKEDRLQWLFSSGKYAILNHIRSGNSKTPLSSSSFIRISVSSFSSKSLSSNKQVNSPIINNNDQLAELLLTFIRFFGRISSYQNTYYILQFFYDLFPSHCPFWFYHLQLVEQLVTYSWNSYTIKHRLLMTKIEPILEKASQYLTNELLWKMFTTAGQAEIRGYTHIRMLLRQRGVREMQIDTD